MKYILIFLTTTFTIINGTNFEKIYAVMITGKDAYHKKLAEKSIQSFLSQTYPNKYLIIVNDGDYSFSNLNKKLIKEIKLKEKHVLGALRNIGLLEIPENCIYLQWDDDDWHHPNLMEEQYKKMILSNADACFLKKQVQYAFSFDSAWIKHKEDGIEGTIMCRKKNHISYPLTPKREDSVFFYEYSKYNTTVFDNPEHYYIRFIHGHNTWDANHFFINQKQKNKHSISADAKKYLSQILPIYNFVKQ